MKIIYIEPFVTVQNNQNQDIFEYETSCPDDLIDELQRMFYYMGFDIEIEKQ